MSILWCSTLVLTVARSALRASLGRFKRSREKERKCHDGAWNTLAKIHRKRKKSSRHFSLAWRAPRDTGSVSDTRPGGGENHRLAAPTSYMPPVYRGNFDSKGYP